MKISVITASYNYAQYLEEAINSVINQSYQDWELIVVDDGSSDNSVEIIKSYCEKDSRIKLLQHEQGLNKGLKETLLLGLKQATGEWIAFLESDDILVFDNLSTKIELLQKHLEVKLIFNRVKFLEENRTRKNSFESTQNNLAKMKFPRNMFFDFFIDNPILTFSCVMVESNSLKNIDFNTPSDTAIDRWLWIHLAHKNDFYYIDQELTSWRLHPESYITKGKRAILCPIQVSAYCDVYKKQEKSLGLFLFIVFSYVKLIFIRCFKLLMKG